MPAHDPGAMTVSFLFGWEHIVTAVLLVIALTVVFLVLAAAGRNVSEQAEFQALLDARSHRRSEWVGTAEAGRLPSDEAGPTTS
jgi:hypothetical protein